MIKLNPYITFNNNAREAMEFYKSVFGGTLNMTTLKEGGAPTTPETENLLMHSELVTENGITLMGTDASMYEFKPVQGMSISLTGSSEDEATLRGYWDKLSEGATITMPLDKAPWGDTFGML